jgi:hypothetical protein
MPESPGCPFCDSDEPPRLLGDTRMTRPIYAFECTDCGGVWLDDLNPPGVIRQPAQ